jgi:hypothetical protein
METIKYENKTYVNADYVLSNAPVYSKGCRSSRDLIKKKNIESSKYLFARLKNNEWVITDGKSPKFDKVFILKSFTKTIPELNNENVKVTDDKGIEKAPDIIYLEDNNKFKDTEGNIIEIETRGEREHDKVYFKVKDVAEGFNIEYLNDSINDKKSNYEINIDYKYFICNKTVNSRQKTDKLTDYKTSTKKELFLTYQGMLRVLFVSRNNKTSHFIGWATKTLFTVQLGTTEQKRELVSSVLGVNAKVIKEVFNTDANTLPCVYLFTLNTVANLRKSMNIPDTFADDSIVCKYGFTKELARRTGEHITTYNKIENVDLKLKHYSYVDPQYMSNAESDIRTFMTALNITYKFEEYKEIVIIPKHLINLVEKQYQQIGKSYMGHIAELITRIKDLEYELAMKDTKMELLTEKHKSELQAKDIEMLNYKIKLLEGK